MAAIGEVIFQKGQDNDSDIWDDTALIKAYDEAVNLMKAKIAAEQGDDEQSTAQEQQKQKSKKSKRKQRNKKREKQSAQQERPSHKWKEGDHCQAVFQEDGLVYGGVITSVNEEDETCIVRYLGYGNEEEQKLSDLLPPFQPNVSPGRKSNDSRSERHSQSHHSEGEDSMDWRGGHSPRPDSVASSIRSSQGKGRGRSSAQQSPRWPNPPHPFMGMAPPPFASFPFMPPMFPQMPSLPGWPGSSEMPGSLPHVPPPPPMPEDLPEDDTEALHSMLIAWYMSGYHTGYYQGLKAAKKKTSKHSHHTDGQNKM